MCGQNRRLALHFCAQWGTVDLKAKSLFIPEQTTVLGIHASGIGASTGCYYFLEYMRGDWCHGGGEGGDRPVCDKGNRPYLNGNE